MPFKAYAIKIYRCLNKSAYIADAQSMYELKLHIARLSWHQTPRRNPQPVCTEHVPIIIKVIFPYAQKLKFLATICSGRVPRNFVALVYTKLYARHYLSNTGKVVRTSRIRHVLT